MTIPVGMLPDGAWFAMWTGLVIDRVPGPHCVGRGQKVDGGMEQGWVRVRWAERWGKPCREAAVDISTHSAVVRAEAPREPAVAVAKPPRPMPVDLAPQELSADPFGE